MESSTASSTASSMGSSIGSIMKLAKEDIKRMTDYYRFPNNLGGSFYMTYNYLGEPFLTIYCCLYIDLCESDQCLDKDLKLIFYKKIKLPLFNKLGFLR